MIDWQAEDEALHATESQHNEGKKGSRRRTWLLVLLCLILLLLPAGFWGYRQIQARNLELARQAAEEHYLLLREAAVLGDGALFTERSGEVGAADAAVALVAGHSWLGRDPFGLAWDKTATPAISVTLTANGRTAEVTAVETYRRNQIDGSAVDVHLAHTLNFAWDSGRWQYAWPGDAFWGAEQETDRQRVRLFYPGEESETVARLADDLDALVTRVCTGLDDVRCATQFQLAIRLEMDPAVLLDPVSAATRSPVLSLPAPAIMGRPVDEAAYAALLDGYTPLVVRAVVAQLAGWECCAGQVFFEVLLDHQLRDLGFPAGLPTNPDLAHLVRKKVQPDDLFNLWNLAPERMSPEMLDRAQAVVGFLLAQEPGVPIVEWQRRLATADNYRDWAGEVAAVDMSPRLRAAWISYLYSRSGVADNTLAETPGQDLLLLCSSGAHLG